MFKWINKGDKREGEAKGKRGVEGPDVLQIKIRADAGGRMGVGAGKRGLQTGAHDMCIEIPYNLKEVQ